MEIGRLGDKNVSVRIRDNPSHHGQTTGRQKSVGTRIYVEVDWGPDGTGFKDLQLLEEEPEVVDPFEDLENGIFGNEGDLRRVLTLEKLQGRLTNVFYSMESCNTEFYPHQFKPVLKFMQSPVGRMLIADEVGLGKTIEAGYIWKELQIREAAQRLLIVCPAVLREKWKTDLARLFSINAQIISAGELVENLRGFILNKTPSEFVYIASVQGLGTPSDFEDDSVGGARAELARLLDNNPSKPEAGLFDLVIIDEAHYLRNLNTYNRMGNLLRDAAKYLLLLTATPIQIASDNLYQLLRLVSPDDFFNKQVFDEIMKANQPITDALRSLWRQPPDIDASRAAVEKTLASGFFSKNSNLTKIVNELGPSLANNRDRKIEIGKILENASLLGNFMSRSRKRDVLDDRVERVAQTLVVNFTAAEQNVYRYVSEKVKELARGRKGVELFSVIARQTQMSSCMVAALQTWTSGGFLDDVLWESMGLDEWTMEGGNTDAGDTGSDKIEWSIPPEISDLKQLEEEDSKYNKLVAFLHEMLEGNSEEKVVLFAFFRGTLEYLQRRLTADDISTTLIMGGMGDAKWDNIREFQKSGGPSVLLSSEVGSEGIDLQFCRVLVNYDLPWNPMRVEQRIGRLDRLGQKAEKILIINLALADTIEERILGRLYNRIEIFKESIGDLEEILGGMTEELTKQLLDPSLSEKEREEKADEIADAILKRRRDQDQLESEAINLLAYSDFVMDSIRDSRDMGRWLQPEELRRLVADFLHQRYAGSMVEFNNRDLVHAKIELSEDAKISLKSFCMEKMLSKRTRLDSANRPIDCNFDPRNTDNLDGMELVDPSHPLLFWVRDQYGDRDKYSHSTSALTLSRSDTKIEPGIYAFAVHVWSFSGIRNERNLVYRLAPVGSKECLDQQASELIIGRAALKGKGWANARNLIEDYGHFLEAVEICIQTILGDFQNIQEEFEADNANRCNVQEESANRFANRRIEEFESRIERFKARNDLRMVPATEGLIRNEKANLQVKLHRISEHRQINCDWRDVSTGVINVE